jgi:hypothetical protein
MKALTLLAALAAVSAISITASADDARTPDAADAPAASASRSQGIEWFAHTGAVGGDGYGGLMTGATVLARRDSLALGGTLEGSAGSATRVAVSATGGWSYRDTSGWGFDLLGAVGMHRYDGVGQALIFSNDPGIGGTVPFAGLRARGVYVFGNGPRHFQLGVGATLDRDLSSVSRSVTYQEANWLTGGTSTATATHTIGFTTVGAMIDLGMTFDSF